MLLFRGAASLFITSEHATKSDAILTAPSWMDLMKRVFFSAISPSKGPCAIGCDRSWARYLGIKPDQKYEDQLNIFLISKRRRQCLRPVSNRLIIDCSGRQHFSLRSYIWS